MLAFLAANPGFAEWPLAPAMAVMLKVRRPITMAGMEIAPGWLVAGNGIVRHNGGTYGFRSTVGFPKARVGLVYRPIPLASPPKGR